MIDRLNTALNGRYRIERELGRGGMAVVYLAEDLRHKRRVALKLLSPDIGQAVGSTRFLREIEIAAGLTHPNILSLHDSGETDGLVYYVMPYVEGESLRDRLNRERQLPVEDTIEIIRGVAEALSHAHASGVIHRDIKPGNILLTTSHPLVADFGIARAIDASGSGQLTETGLAVGTPTYMSPEQAAGDQKIDGRSDTYSLACVAYEMLGGEPPFTGPSPQAVLARHSLDPVPPLTTLRPSLPAPVVRVLEKALSKTAADRFPQTTDFAKAFQRALEETPSPRAGRRAIPLIAGITTLAVAGWLAVTLFTRSTTAIPRLAVLPLTSLLDTSQVYFVQGMHDGLITELQQAGFGVINRTSMMQYATGLKPVREIATEVGADLVVETSVARTGDSVSLDVRLIDPETEEYRWRGAFGSDLAGTAALHRQVTRAIADELHLALTPENAARLANLQRVHPEAYEAYLKGRFHQYQFTPSDLELALKYYESALAIDSTYALAYVGIAGVWGYRRPMALDPPRVAREASTAAALKALELDSTLAEAHYALAGKQAWEGNDSTLGEQEFRRALELNPSFAEARAFLSHLLTILGRLDEAEAQIRRAMELDPLNPFFQHLYGAQLMFAGRFDEAITQSRKVVSLTPSNPLPHRVLWAALHHQGRFDEAADELDAYLGAMGDTDAVTAFRQGRSESGYREAMVRAAEAYATRPPEVYPKAFLIASLYARAGNIDEAFRWMNRAYEAEDVMMRYLGVEPFPTDFRSDQRLDDLLGRLKLARENWR